MTFGDKVGRIEKVKKEPQYMGKIVKIRNTRKIYIPIYLMIIILLFSISYIKFSGKEVNDLAFKASLLFSAATLIFTEIHRYFNFYEINQNSLIYSTGFIKNTTRRIDLLSISDADAIQTIWQKMLNYGDVHVRLFAKDTSVYMDGVNDPLQVVDFLIGLIDEKREVSPE